MKHPPLPARLAAPALCFVLVCALAGCGGSAGTENFSAAPAAMDQTAAAEAESYGAGLTGAGAQSDRKLVVNAELWLDATDFDAAAAEIERQVEALGGYLASSSRDGSADSSSRSARYEARIPAGKLASFLEGAGKTGTVVSSSQSTADVTAQYVDNEARLSSLRTQEQRLLELMSQAQKLEDLITLEDKLSEVRYEIESIERQLRNWQMQVDYSTISLDLREVAVYTPTATVQRTFGEKMSDAFSDGWSGFVRGLQSFAMFLARSLPGLVILAVFVIAVIVVIRRFRRSRAVRCAKEHLPPDDKHET